MRTTTRIVAAMAVGVAVLAAGASVSVSGADAGTSRVKLGPGQAINIPAIAMTSRATLACPASPGGGCEQRPGLAGPSTPITALEGYLTEAEGAFFAPVHMPAGSRILRVEIVGIDADHGIDGPSATLQGSRIGQRVRNIAAAGIDGFSSRPTRAISRKFMTPGFDAVRADTSYGVRLDVPSTVDGGYFAIQMVRVIYRPPGQ